MARRVRAWRIVRRRESRARRVRRLHDWRGSETTTHARRHGRDAERSGRRLETATSAAELIELNAANFDAFRNMQQTDFVKRLAMRKVGKVLPVDGDAEVRVLDRDLQLEVRAFLEVRTCCHLHVLAPVAIAAIVQNHTMIAIETWIEVQPSDVSHTISTFHLGLFTFYSRNVRAIRVLLSSVMSHEQIDIKT